ncbi:hypothetical protein [Robbsia sp. KACC 23696]|uniref:hypothetical protein n=1 Tax=Robbsia sp. KACC 23696 TaxID=3149231 RepID=UPI00325B1387
MSCFSDSIVMLLYAGRCSAPLLSHSICLRIFKNINRKWNTIQKNGPMPYDIVYPRSCALSRRVTARFRFPVSWNVAELMRITNKKCGCRRTDAGILSIGFRPLVIYGAGRESGSSAGPSLACRAAATHTAYTIPFTGTTGLIFADDVAAAYEAALLHPIDGAHVFTLAGHIASIETVIETLSQIVPDATIDAAGTPLPIASHFPVDEAFQTLFPNLQETRLIDGLKQTIDFYRHT